MIISRPLDVTDSTGVPLKSFFFVRTLFRAFTTASPVNGVPSWNSTLSLSMKVHVILSLETLQLFASFGSIPPFPSEVVRVSIHPIRVKTNPEITGSIPFAFHGETITSVLSDCDAMT